MVFTVVSPSWTTVFFRCSGYLRNLCFVFSTPRGEVGTSFFIFPSYSCNSDVEVSCVLQCFSCFETNFFIDVLSNFETAFWSRTTLVVESAHRLSHLLSDLLICKNQCQGCLSYFARLQFLVLQNCRTILNSLGVPCQKRRTVVRFCFSLFQNCRTVPSSVGVPCQNCRTMVRFCFWLSQICRTVRSSLQPLLQIAELC